MENDMTGMVLWGSKQSTWAARTAAVLMVIGATACQDLAGEQTAGDHLDAQPAAASISATSRAGSSTLRPLSSEPVPQPAGGHTIDQGAAIRLGKALFWDVQAGGDGQVA